MSEIESRSPETSVEVPKVSSDLNPEYPALGLEIKLVPTSDNQSNPELDPQPKLIPENLPEIFQVRLKSVEGKLHLLLPAEPKRIDPEDELLPNFDWTDLLGQLEQRLSSGERFWQPDTAIYLAASDRLLDANQLQDISEALSRYSLNLVSVQTQRRQTAIAAAGAGLSVEQVGVASDLASKKLEPEILDEPLYLKMTVRSGTEIKHSGTVIIWGDVNAGGEVIADGDILVWGKLRGKAHAGARGNMTARIMALYLDPTQLRIADQIARVDTPNKHSPEIAYISDDQICIIAVS